MRRQEPSEAADLNQLEERLELLKIAFERYFSGVDRVPPVREQASVRRAFRSLLRLKSSNSVYRYRASGLRQRLAVYEQHWARILRAIEDGSYTRVVAEGKRRQREEMRKMRDAREGRDTSAATAGKSSPPERSGGELRQLYEQYVEARRVMGQGTGRVSYEALAAKLQRQIPKLEARHGVRVRLEVVTEHGKVRFRARPQRG
ncbi:MAG: MXAN_5187 C-terminal domain-containing protein [Nannocystaceae bacterium]